MTKSSRMILIAIIALVVVLMIFVSTSRQKSATQNIWVCENGEWVKKGNPTDPMPKEGCGEEDEIGTVVSSPVDTVENFYNWIMSYEGNTLSDRSYQMVEYLTDEFKSKIDATLDQMEEEQGGYDPFLCAQDMPASYRVGVPQILDNTALVKVEQTFDTGKRLLPVELVRVGDMWMISDIKCDDVEPQTGLDTDTEESANIIVYFNNADRVPEGMDECGVVYGVERQVSMKQSTLEAKLNELLKGPTQSETGEGYTSFFSEATADALIGVNVVGTTAYINLKDIRQIIPNASTSCGSQQFLAQIQETVKHDRQIDRVMIAINGDPEPLYEWLQIGCAEENDFCSKDGFVQ